MLIRVAKSWKRNSLGEKPLTIGLASEQIRFGTSIFEKSIRAAVVAAEIEDPPRNAVVSELESLRWGCGAVGRPRNITWTWYKDGANLRTLEGMIGGRFRVDPQGSLLVDPVYAKDSGNYTCRVFNGIGAPHQASATLTVECKASAPPMRADDDVTPVIEPPRCSPGQGEGDADSAVSRSRDARNPGMPRRRESSSSSDQVDEKRTSLRPQSLPLQILATPKRLPPHPSGPGSPLDLFPSSISRLYDGSCEQVSEEDAGFYTCEGENALGSAGVSRLIEVEVEETQDFLTSPSKVYRVMEGDSFLVPCSPPRGSGTSVQWNKVGRGAGDVELKDRVTDLGLRFEDVRSSDAGEYECILLSHFQPKVARTLVLVVSSSDASPFLTLSHIHTFSHHAILVFCSTLREDHQYITWYKEEKEEEWYPGPGLRPGIKESNVTLTDLSPGTTYQVLIDALRPESTHVSSRLYNFTTSASSTGELEAGALVKDQEVLKLQEQNLTETTLRGEKEYSYFRVLNDEMVYFSVWPAGILRRMEDIIEDLQEILSLPQVA
ncbi:unnamed protein product [Darwinula stevensoni]|uniref:Ig-like domain-containing protein n=1 Tax=Darwinula stevensoni TaxID=69355 RepID=A0A7R9A923_9CRUS|nr:unnamed protein product [Darwinula stevensoni]CAG0896989.1 unnamed protein product [Darwinula stevensoni]